MADPVCRLLQDAGSDGHSRQHDSVMSHSVRPLVSMNQSLRPFDEVTAGPSSRSETSPGEIEQFINPSESASVDNRNCQGYQPSRSDSAVDASRIGYGTRDYVVLICYAVCAGDECSGGSRRILCYECSTKRQEGYCKDPFNESSRKVKTVLCDGYCVKLVQIKGNDMNVTRTCASKLTLNLHPALVCMKESRPGDGHMCFCDSKKCNDAASLRMSSALLLLPFILTRLKSFLN